MQQRGTASHVNKQHSLCFCSLSSRRLPAMNRITHPRTVLLLSVAIASLFLITACGGNGGGGMQPAPTATLTASPTTIMPGQTATLGWTTTNASAASIDNGVGTVTPVGGGSVAVQP